MLGKLRTICLYDTFGINDLCWSPDGNSIAVAHGSAVDIWNPGGGSRIWTYEGLTDPVQAITWSPDGTRVASASKDETVHIWQVGEDRTPIPAS